MEGATSASQWTNNYYDYTKSSVFARQSAFICVERTPKVLSSVYVIPIFLILACSTDVGYDKAFNARGSSFALRLSHLSWVVGS